MVPNRILAHAIFALAFLFFHSTVQAADIEIHLIQSEYQNGEQQIRVLLPDNYSRDHSYRVLYVLPVEKGFETEFGFGLDVLQKMDAHNRYNLIIVQMGFEKEPWFGDHATDPQVRQASYMKEFVIPFIEKRYSTLGTSGGRLLLGFSKSGWGAFSLIMTYPEFFGYAAAWDAPMMFNRFYFGMESIYGTIEQLKRFQFDQLAPKQKAFFSEKTRLVLTGEKLWGKTEEDAHQQGIPYSRSPHAA